MGVIVMYNPDGCVLLELKGIQVVVVNDILFDKHISCILDPFEQFLVIQGSSILRATVTSWVSGFISIPSLNLFLSTPSIFERFFANPNCAGWANQASQVQKGDVGGFHENLFGRRQSHFRRASSLSSSAQTNEDNKVSVAIATKVNLEIMESKIRQRCGNFNSIGKVLERSLILESKRYGLPSYPLLQMPIRSICHDALVDFQ